MGTDIHGKLGHEAKVISAEEKQKEEERYKRAGYSPGNQSNQAASIGFVNGVLTGQTIVAVDCGDTHTVCVTENGQVYSWGRGKFGALGHGTIDDIQQPKQIEGLSNVVDVRCGADYTIVKNNKGKLYAFGDNTYG